MPSERILLQKVMNITLKSIDLLLAFYHPIPTLHPFLKVRLSPHSISIQIL